MVVPMSMSMPMPMPMTQQQGTDNVDEQTDNGDEGRGAKLNRCWLQQTHERFNANAQRNHAKNQRRGEPAQVSNLSCTETVALAGSVAFCVSVSGRRDAQCAGMGCHVEAIGQ